MVSSSELRSHAATLRNFIFNFDPIEFKDPEASGAIFVY